MLSDDTNALWSSTFCLLEWLLFCHTTFLDKGISLKFISIKFFCHLLIFFVFVVTLILYVDDIRKCIFYTIAENLTLKVSFSRILCKKIMSLTQNGTVKVSLQVFALVLLVKKHRNSTFHSHFSVKEMTTYILSFKSVH